MSAQRTSKLRKASNVRSSVASPKPAPEAGRGRRARRRRNLARKRAHRFRTRAAPSVDRLRRWLVEDRGPATPRASERSSILPGDCAACGLQASVSLVGRGWSVGLGCVCALYVSQGPSFHHCPDVTLPHAPLATTPYTHTWRSEGGACCGRGGENPTEACTYPRTGPGSRHGHGA